MDVSALLSSAKDMYEKCEKTGNVTLNTKANFLHRTAEDKKKQVEVLSL